MAIRRGSSTPSAIYRGATAVQKVMRGTVEVWAATIYPQSGTWGPQSLPSSRATYASHTIAETGSYTITHAVTRTAGFGSVRGHIAGPWGSTDGPSTTPTSTASTTQSLTAGQVVNMDATGGNNTGSGSWSIVKN